MGNNFQIKEIDSLEETKDDDEETKEENYITHSEK